MSLGKYYVSSRLSVMECDKNICNVLITKTASVQIKTHNYFLQEYTTGDVVINA